MRGIVKPARFDRPVYSASIPENSPAGHPVIVVAFNGTMPVYELVPRQGACWQDFEVDRQSGVLVSKVGEKSAVSCKC